MLLKIILLDGLTVRVFNNINTKTVIKMTFLANYVDFFQIFKISNKFICIYFNIKYRFCENSNKAGPVAFALALNPHHDDNVHTSSHQFIGSRGDLITDIFLEN